MDFKIYTKTGDQGETSLFGGRRVSKDDLRIEAYGTIDELNAQLGLLKDHLGAHAQHELLVQIQNKLFTIGSRLAVDPEKPIELPGIEMDDIQSLEAAIDEMDGSLRALKHFLLPGGHVHLSLCHVARCVCRRAERRVVSLNKVETVDPLIIQYLNRLSDYFFVLSRKVAQDLGVEEIKWNA